jgi:lipoprotein signal peptidase
MKLFTLEPLKSPVALLCFFGAAGIGLATDLITKQLAVAHLKGQAAVKFIPYLLQFEYTENRGAVFGLGQGRQAMFLIVSIVAIGYLVWLFATSGKSRLLQIILGMLTAGVIGNMYDRMRFGYVRDMIHGLPGVHWPGWVVERLPRSWQPMTGQSLEVFPWIFNVADSLLCVGVGAMIVYLYLSERQRKKMGVVAENAKESPGSAEAAPGA